MDDLLELQEFFKRQLTTAKHINSYKFLIEKDRMYITVNTSISENIFFNDSVKSFGYRLSMHLNRRTIYKGVKSIICGTALTYEIDPYNIINPKTPTMNEPIIFDSIQEKDSFYEYNSIIISMINALDAGIDVPFFKRVDNKIYYRDDLVIIINDLKSVIKQCNRSGSMRDYDCWFYHMYVMDGDTLYPLNSVINKIVMSYNMSHSKTLRYSSLGRENSNWILEDDSGKKHFEGDWDKLKLYIPEYKTNVSTGVTDWKSFFLSGDL